MSLSNHPDLLPPCYLPQECMFSDMTRTAQLVVHLPARLFGHDWTILHWSSATAQVTSTAVLGRITTCVSSFRQSPHTMKPTSGRSRRARTIFFTTPPSVSFCEPPRPPPTICGFWLCTFWPELCSFWTRLRCPLRHSTASYDSRSAVFPVQRRPSE
ncbi:hypothetical protein OF83DRAFT_175357 [Amylostereum chailletii]|nr:hypothetical protein OF83DRAFT_175357 [Amylostereum chailletii]